MPRQFALLYLDVPSNEAAEFIRRFLNEAIFDTQAKRLGLVVRIRAGGMQFWRKGQAAVQRVRWTIS